MTTRLMFVHSVVLASLSWGSWMLVGSPSATLAQQPNPFHDAFSKLATREAGRLLQGKKLPLEKDSFAGTIEAIAPEKNLVVSIKSVSLENDKLRMTANLSGMCAIEGKADISGTKFDVMAHLNVALQVQAEATLSIKNGAYFITPHVGKLDVTSVSVESISPKDLAGGRALISAVISNEFRRNNRQIRDFLNVQLKELQIK